MTEEQPLASSDLNILTSPKLSTEPDESDSIDRSELTLISTLEEQLRALHEEIADLRSELNAKEEVKRKQQDIHLNRYLNSDFWISQLNAVMPAKRARLIKQGSAPSDKLAMLEQQQAWIPCRYLLEPATNLVYRKMHQTTKEAQIRVRQSHDDLLAWKFSPESASGKRLMSRMRHLLNANEQLGRANQADRISMLESEVEVQSTCIKEFLKTQEGMEGVLEEAYVDLEGIQSSLLMLQQQLNQTESVVQLLQNELEAKQPGRAAELMEAILLQLSQGGETHEAVNHVEVTEDGPDNQTDSPNLQDHYEDEFQNTPEEDSVAVVPKTDISSSNVLPKIDSSLT